MEKKKLNLSKSFFPTTQNTTDPFINQIVQQMQIASSLQNSFESIILYIKQNLQDKKSYQILDFKSFQLLIQTIKDFAIQQYQLQSLVKILAYFNLKNLSQEEANTIDIYIHEIMNLISNQQPYILRHQVQSFSKLIEKQGIRFLKCMVQLLNQNRFLQNMEGLIFINQTIKILNDIFNLDKGISLNLVEQFLQINFKFYFIGTDKFQLKSYLLKNNQEYIMSEVSEWEGQEGLTSLQIIFQKIRNYSSIFFQTIIRQYPNILINSKNYLQLVKPQIISSQFLDKFFELKIRSLGFQQEYTFLEIFQFEPSLPYQLIVETFQKNKINIINTLMILIENFNQNYPFQVSKYQKQQKITNPNFLPIAHQVYNSIINLYCSICFQLTQELQPQIINLLLKLIAIFIKKQYFYVLGDKLINHLHFLLIQFLKLSEEVSIKQNAMNCLSHLFSLESNALHSVFGNPNNLIHYSLENIKNQLKIETLRSEPLQGNNGSILFFFENLLFIQKMQQFYGNYFEEQFDVFVQVFHEVYNNKSEFNQMRLVLFYKIWREMARTLQNRKEFFKIKQIKNIIQLFPQILKSENEEVIKEGLKIALFLSEHLQYSQLQDLLNYLFQDLNIINDQIKANFYKLLGCFSQNQILTQNLSQQIIKQLHQNESSQKIILQQTQAIQLWSPHLTQQNTQFLQKILKIIKSDDLQIRVLGFQALSFYGKKFDFQIDDYEFLVRLFKNLEDGNMFKSLRRLIKYNKNFRNKMIENGILQVINETIIDNEKIQVLIELMKICLTLFDKINFQNSLILFCQKQLEQKVDAKFSEFKYFEKFKLVLVELSTKILPEMNYQLYEYIWFYIKKHVANALVLEDFSQMEEYVENQMKLVQQNYQESFQTSKQKIQFNLWLIEDQKLLNKTKEKLQQLQQNCRIFENQHQFILLQQLTNVDWNCMNTLYY